MQILLDTLDKKISVLNETLRESKLQEEELQKPEVNWDEFDAGVERKGKLIEELVRLDDGFNAIFEHKKDELLNNREQYRDVIAGLQKRIREITELSTNLEKQELGNKTLVVKAFAETRERMREGKRSSKVAMDYYTKMNRVNYIDPQLLDRKS